VLVSFARKVEVKAFVTLAQKRARLDVEPHPALASGMRIHALVRFPGGFVEFDAHVVQANSERTLIRSVPLSSSELVALKRARG